METSLKKALRLAALYTAGAILLAAALIAAALYWPENWLLRDDSSSVIDRWLPAANEIPADMILVSEQKNTNEDVADSFENEKEVEQMLDDWGRMEGFQKLYVSKDRCQTESIRQINVQGILYESNGGQNHIEWSMERDRSEGQTVTAGEPVGDFAYRTMWITEGVCAPDEEEIVVEIFFRRGRVLGDVIVSGVKGAMTDQELIEITRKYARIIDEKIQRAPGD